MKSRAPGKMLVRPGNGRGLAALLMPPAAALLDDGVRQLRARLHGLGRDGHCGGAVAACGIRTRASEMRKPYRGNRWYKPLTRR